MIHTVKGFGIVNKAAVSLALSCFFDDLSDVGNLISGSSAFSKSSVNICKFTVHILLKPGLKNFEHYLASMWGECNCVVVWTFFGIAFLWDWNENWPFPVLWPLLFSKFAGILSAALSIFTLFVYCYYFSKRALQTRASALWACVQDSLWVYWVSLTVTGDWERCFFTSWLGDSYTTNIWELLFLSKIDSFLLGVFVHVPWRYKLSHLLQ